MDWFKNTFLASFGFCNGKRISMKQFGIFEKYLHDYIYKQTDSGNTITTEYHFGNSIIVLQDSLAGYGKGKWTEQYLTIRRA